MLYYFLVTAALGPEDWLHDVDDSHYNENILDDHIVTVPDEDTGPEVAQNKQTEQNSVNQCEQSTSNYITSLHFKNKLL